MRGENIRFCAVLHEAILGDRYPVRIISARTLFVTLTGIEERMPDIILLHPFFQYRFIRCYSHGIWIITLLDLQHADCTSL